MKVFSILCKIKILDDLNTSEVFILWNKTQVFLIYTQNLTLELTKKRF